MNLRPDLRQIYDWVPADSRVLDLGCGDGTLLA
ncbi:methionine biosynthesis protein MetW, partial [Staphylococcus aureus]|nr:methionine biosynthesis protein MetW [Staphylococcus aureus]